MSKKPDAESADAAAGQSASSSVPPVVGIGASAGGLDAFQRLLSNVPESNGIAWVLIQHLAPDRESQLAEILSRSTSMPVEEVTQATRVQPDRVYVIAPGRVMRIAEGVLQPAAETDPLTRRSTIDAFLISLAEDRGENAGCGLLSGAGSDGTIGLKAIKEANGPTLAQAAETAEYDSMLLNAVRTGMVDRELAIEEMGQVFVEVMHKLASPAALDGLDEAERQRVCRALLEGTGNDFRAYKPSTLDRRIRRRMQVLGFERPADYVERLEADAKEAMHLFRDLLIGVTQFFRDPAAFEALEKGVVPKLLEGKTEDDEIRVWAAGCATGEETYSLAMVLHEQASQMESAPRIRVFGSDIDDNALHVARVARYPKGIAADVSPERLKRYFDQEDDTYIVRRQLRELCLFAQHNVLHDPPFSRIDLLSCRNVMIYMNADLQRQLLPVFHYALRAQGVLFLGPAETAGQTGDYFVEADRKHRIFRRADRPPRLTDFPIAGDAASRGKRRSGGERDPTGAQAADPSGARDRVLARFVPPYVIVDRDFEIREASAGTGRFLELPVGPPRMNLGAMARKGLAMDVKAALLKAMASGKPSVRTNVLHGEGDERRAVTLQVEPLGADDGGPAQLFVVVFQDKPAPVPEALSSGNDAGDAELVRVLELELQSTKERLQTTAEELERSNEDLRISNEELSSVNEELQSSNEELETSKEELQSINEELRSVNAELTTRVEELGRANNDLRNLFASTQIAMLFLDRDLQIMNFTPPAKALFKLRDHDVGRPLDELRLIVQCDDLRDHLVRVIETGEVVERDVETIPGHDRVPHTYMMTVLPYRDEEDRITGGVVTLVDITALRDSERALAAERKFMTDVIESAPIGISIAEAPHGKNPILNREARQMLGFDSFPDDLTRYEGLGAVHPDGRPYAVEEYPTVRVLKSGTAAEREEMIFERDGERRRWIVDSAPVRDAEGKLVAAVTTFLDIEEQRRSEEHRQLLIDELNHRVKNTLAVVQSIANQTFRRADVAREAVEAFETRLTALSTAHNLLTRTSWRHADLRDLVEGLRDAHAGWRARIRQSGQQVRLAPKQAIALSLALHELCTNAMKYGALSVEDGTVEVTWHKTGDAGFELFWTEAGGPSVEPPAREGFGLRMMRMALANDLEGTIDFDFHNTGLVCTVKAPIGMETTP